jgi:hypothetical protein
MFGKKLIASAGIAASLVWASTANAATVVAIEFQENGGPITVPVGEFQSADFASYVGSFGSWIVNNTSGSSDDTTNSFGTTSLNKATKASTLDVYVTLLGIEDPTGLLNVKSVFTQNSLPAGFTVTEATYFKPNNELWGTDPSAILIASHPFSSPDTFTSNDLVNVLTAPFAVTARYTIVANGAGQALSTIDINAQTPLPGTLPLIASGLGALWMVGRKRKARKAPAVA